MQVQLFARQTYKTDVFVPGEWEGKDIVIRFGSATHKARVFVNGTELDSHVGGFLPFNVCVNDVVKYNEYNKLAVLVNNELSETMIPCGLTTTLKNGKKVSKPYFDFYNYAGIHRPVKLLCLPKEKVTDFTVNHRLVGADAEVDYTVETSGDLNTVVEVYDAEGNKVAEATGKEGTLVVKEAKLRAQEKINEAEKYRTMDPLFNCTELTNKLSSVKSNIGASHYDYIESIVNQMEQYSYMTKTDFDNLMTTVNNAIKEYNENRSIYGSNSKTTDDLKQRASNYYQEAYDFFN